MSTNKRDIGDKLTRRIRREAPAGRLLVCVSGGSDSVAMLRALAGAGLDMDAANCNFHLRGEESDRDSRFVAALCRRLGVRLHSADFQADVYARERGISTEMACRELRHRWWDRLVEEEGYSRIVTGHNASDNAETLLLNLLRGSGVDGLKGMLPDDGRVWRPLLDTSRREILEYLDEIGQEYVTDSTNLESDYRRNYLRNKIMPLLRERWKGADRGIARTLGVLRKEQKILRHFIDRALEGCHDRLPTERITDFPEASTLIFHFIRTRGGTPETADEMVRSLNSGEHIGKRWRLDSGEEAVFTVHGLEIIGAERSPLEPEWEEIDLRGEKFRKTMERMKSDGNMAVWLPEGPNAYELRETEAGDRMRPLGMTGSRLVSDIIAEGHLGAEDKRAMRVLVRKKDGEIIWVPGLKRSRHELLHRNSIKAWRVHISEQKKRNKI